MKKIVLTFAQLLPVILSMLVVGAHFLRYGNMIIISIIAVLILALLIKRSFVARATQLALVLFTAEWIYTAYFLISYRLYTEQPWMRLTAILTLVIIFTFASIFVFKTKNLKERYAL